ncbi:hypothetical protein QEL84_001199 [Pseudomonas putida]|uniref:Uncharacterized protein n=2 Tax=Pseudomonas TaxID=286 RepID=A0A1Y3KHG2_PSEPU|nr:hypothetical protein [Pseudomonas putida]EKT4460456.1 hypothetical protein [Pseudomonas putida]ELU0814909.1 hypothetical protein [Pseudomonas putida]OUM23711.1 hypothetical protein B8W72_27830 [Pseudomonas putida]
MIPRAFPTWMQIPGFHTLLKKQIHTLGTPSKAQLKALDFFAAKNAAVHSWSASHSASFAVKIQATYPTLSMIASL